MPPDHIRLMEELTKEYLGNIIETDVNEEKDQKDELTKAKSEIFGLKVRITAFERFIGRRHPMVRQELAELEAQVAAEILNSD